jgi:hypothetical protein
VLHGVSLAVEAGQVLHRRAERRGFDPDQAAAGIDPPVSVLVDGQEGVPTAAGRPGGWPWCPGDQVPPVFTGQWC